MVGFLNNLTPKLAKVVISALVKHWCASTSGLNTTSQQHPQHNCSATTHSNNYATHQQYNVHVKQHINNHQHITTIPTHHACSLYQCHIKCTSIVPHTPATLTFFTSLIYIDILILLSVLLLIDLYKITLWN